MSDQTFASLSLNELQGHSATHTPAPRSGRSSTDPPNALGRMRQRRNAELGFRVSTLLFLACVAFVGTATIVVLFGVSFYSLEHRTKEILAGAGDPGGSAPVVTRPERPFSADAASPAEPATGGGSPGAKMTTATLTVLAQLGASGPQRVQTTRPDSTTTEKPGLAPAELSEPVIAQDGKHFELKRLREAIAETVHGAVTEVPDAMTWIVGDQIVRLWGIRPGPEDSLATLVRFLDWVGAKGPIECRRQAHSSRYKCSTATGEDIAEEALFAGVGRAADGASLAYQSAEAQTRRKGPGPRAKR